MASVCDDGKRKRIVYVGTDGQRRTIYLRCDRRTAESIARHVENILASRVSGQPLPRDTASWVSNLSDALRSKLERQRLLEPKEASSPTLGEWVENYLSRQTHVKPASLLAVKQATRNLIDFFGADRRLANITAGDADDFKKWLLSDARSARQPDMPRRLSHATCGKRLSYACSIFADAVRHEIIARNPFEGVKRPGATNPARQAYVPVEWVERLIREQAPNAEWRLLLAMSRYLGVRVPSEPFSMTWGDVDWEHSRLRIPSPKTAGHGKDFRLVPLLPEVRVHLEAVFDAAPEGSVYVFHQLRQRPAMRQAQRGFWQALNLRQQLQRMIERAGLPGWPRLWHQLRASAQTDLASRLPQHVVCAWLGNTQSVAMAHYLQVNDGHFAEAMGVYRSALRSAPTDGSSAFRSAPCGDTE
jgi:integrase